MDQRPSTHTFSNFHNHHHRTSCPLTLPSLQSPEIEYPSAQSPLGALEQFEIQGGESTTTFPTSGNSSGRRRESGDDVKDIHFTNISGLDGNAGYGGHLDGDTHFANSWFGKKEEVWQDGESDVFYTRNCSSDDAGSCRAESNDNSYSHLSCEAKEELVYNREVCRRVDHSRLNSRVNDGYLDGDDFGSSSGSGEDPPSSTGMEPGPWFGVSPSNQIPGVVASRWRSETDVLSLASGHQPIGLNTGRYIQKLDSFSDAFPSHRKRGFPMYSGGNAFAQVWEHGMGQWESPGLFNSRQSCPFDSFPSPPPAASHLMPSVLSPPPTPLPPLNSPSKTDSPSAFGGNTHLVSQGGETLGMHQFFPSLPQAVPPVHPSGVIWKLPLLTTCFPPSSGDPSCNQSNSQHPHGADDSNIIGSQNNLHSSESLFIESSSHRSPLNPLRAPKNTSVLSSPLQLPVCASQLSGQHYDAMDQSTPCMVAQKMKNGPPSLGQSQLQKQAVPFYTGTPFPSILHYGRDQRRSQYTPQPLLNPDRRGAGLYSSLLSASHREEWASSLDEADQCVLACINVGRDFQAEVPPCLLEREGSDEESPKEQLLWKPWDELNNSPNSQDQVEKLLMMCSSSCLPGGGNNTELALHCLHHCKGNIMAALEMLLFSQPSQTPGYHYSGSDVWTDSEKSLFSAALRTHGKYFSLIQKKVRTKTVCQCVEFYYLNKKHQDMQKKYKEEEDRDRRLEQQKNLPPMSQPMNRQFARQEAVHVPALASFFPCKLCGKMFYKIKSRNAHMKIHRQPQEDWADRRLQQQLLTQRLALNLPTTEAPTPERNLIPRQALTQIFSCGLDVTSRNIDADNASGLRHNNASILDHNPMITVSNANARSSSIPFDSGEPTSTFRQSWSLFGHNQDPTTFYCEPEGKESLGAETGAGKGPINWQ